MVRETKAQSQVELYQRLKKWYLMPPCLTLGIISVVAPERVTNENTNTDIRIQIILHKKERVTLKR